MKTAKWAACGLVMVFALVFTAPLGVQAGQGVENYWPIVPGAKGDRSTGQLTIYYDIIDDAGCTGIGSTSEPSAKMVFLLKLYDKKAKVWHIITAVNEGPFCLTSGLATGAQQGALLDFLDDYVLPRLRQYDPSYSQIYLKDVVDDYENTLTPPTIPPYCVCAEITIVAE